MSRRIVAGFVHAIVAVSSAGLLLAAPDAGTAPAGPARFEPLEDCSGLYKEARTPHDFEKAFGCFRAQDDWIMVSIMQVNGEGTRVDLAGARASLNRVDSKDADFEELGRIITKREATPTIKGPRVDFCRDVAMTTLSSNSCQADAQEKKNEKSDTQLRKVRAGLEPGVRAAFDRAQAAYEKFVKADGQRVYQEYIDGSVRNQEAMDQEARVRRSFMATIKLLTTGPADRLGGRRRFGDADKELNAVYNENVSSYVRSNEESAVDAVKRKDLEMAAEYRTRNSDYKTKSHAAQHEWVRYRDAMGDVAAARWRDRPDAREQARALVTEDRIRELLEK